MVGRYYTNQQGERMRLLRTDNEYVPRHGCRNLGEKKITAGGIYHDKTCTQGKDGAGFTIQSLQ